MKKITALLFILFNSYCYSQEIMNFYIEPTGENEITLETLVFNWQFSSFANKSIDYNDNIITVTLCYLNTSAQAGIYDTQITILNLPIGFSSYTINVELFGDNDATLPCSMSNLVDTGTITFDYPYDNSAITFIPDNVFEDYLEDLGFGDDILNNDLVYTNRIENMTNLFLNNIPEDIYSMEGLKEFILLRDLRCNGHEISNLDVSCNLNLELLWCHNNPINQIDVSNNVNLKWLNTNLMNLTSLDVTNNKSLETLSIGVNKISNIDVSQNINLISLGVSYNSIENIDVTTNLALEYLGCSNNLLTLLNVTNNTNLKELDFFNNSITDINLSNITLLERLICNDTQITELDLSNNINLQDIIAYNNQFSSLNIRNGNNENIETLLTFDNPNLFCIQVDDVVYANNADWNVDDWTSFSEDCFFGINDISLYDKVGLYPNPVSTTLTLDNSSNVQIRTIKIYDVLGKLVLQEKEQFTRIDVSQLNSGLLFLKLETEQGVLTKKVVKN